MVIRLILPLAAEDVGAVEPEGLFSIHEQMSHRWRVQSSCRVLPLQFLLEQLLTGAAPRAQQAFS